VRLSTRLQKIQLRDSTRVHNFSIAHLQQPQPNIRRPLPKIRFSKLTGSQQKKQLSIQTDRKSLKQQSSVVKEFDDFSLNEDYFQRQRQ